MTTLCETCQNKDEAFVLHGQKYVPQDICVYEMTTFPRAHKCHKYEPGYPEDDDE